MGKKSGLFNALDRIHQFMNSYQKTVISGVVGALVTPLIMLSDYAESSNKEPVFSLFFHSTSFSTVLIIGALSFIVLYYMLSFLLGKILSKINDSKSYINVQNSLCDSDNHFETNSGFRCGEKRTIAIAPDFINGWSPDMVKISVDGSPFLRNALQMDIKLAFLDEIEKGANTDYMLCSFENKDQVLDLKIKTIASSSVLQVRKTLNTQGYGKKKDDLREIYSHFSFLPNQFSVKLIIENLNEECFQDENGSILFDVPLSFLQNASWNTNDAVHDYVEQKFPVSLIIKDSIRSLALILDVVSYKMELLCVVRVKRNSDDVKLVGIGSFMTDIISSEAMRKELGLSMLLLYAHKKGIDNMEEDLVTQFWEMNGRNNRG